MSQFSDEGGNKGLKSLFSLPRDVYPVGRLDLDSEGLLILTNDKKLNHKLLDPKFGHSRTYWVQVDGEVGKDAILNLEQGVEININGKSYMTAKAKAEMIDNSELEEREPPINYKKHPVTSWIELSLKEGKNRQVRRMTAKVGHPTLRLIRIGIEDIRVFPMKPGEITEISKNVLFRKLHISD